MPRATRFTITEVGTVPLDADTRYAAVSNVIPSIIIFSSGKPELWTPRTYTRSRRREKNEFGISRGYISIILIYFEGSHENVENVRKSKKNRKNFKNMEFQKCI